jgi:hypothetical protein
MYQHLVTNMADPDTTRYGALVALIALLACAWTSAAIASVRDRRRAERRGYSLPPYRPVTFHEPTVARSGRGRQR